MSQIVYVPFDVVTQQMMVSTGQSRVSESALSVARGIVAANGPLGLYRGFGITLVAYLPGSSVCESLRYLRTSSTLLAAARR